MRNLLHIALTLLPMLAHGQKAWVADNGAKHPIDAKEATLSDKRPALGTDTAAIMAHLLETLPHLSTEGCGLRLEHSSRSPKALHFQFAQTYAGRKVFRGSVKVNVALDGRVLSIFDHTFALPDGTGTDFPPHGPFHDGLMEHYASPGNGKLGRYALEETFFWDGATMRPAIRLEVLETTDRYYEMVLGTDVRVIYQNDLLTYFAPAPQDSLVTLWVFNPDPLTTSGQVYGIPYSDQNDQDIPELNAERIPVQAMATFDNGTFHLRNSAVEITEFSSPATSETTSGSNLFNFTRSEDGFEDCNTLHHITRMRDHVHQLGFTDLMDYAIHADAHALNGTDNSNFNAGSNPPRLSFGEGGVDDAEDADVIIHEYGHAIMHSAAPLSNVGTERRALDEAIGDYFASSYSRSINDSRWADVFTWDGHNEYWTGRSTLSTKHYPEHLQQNIYSDAPIWSATLMQIWNDIGREATDAIMLQAAYSFSMGMTMPQAALLFLQADTLLFDGAHSGPIHQHMYDRGLIPWDVGIPEIGRATNPYILLGSGNFANGLGPVTVSGPAPFTISLTDVLGRTLLNGLSASDSYALSPDALPSGLFLLTVHHDGKGHSFKLIRR
ncbi:MAG: hypothetical protein K9J06_10480 [Flavobacteriales bacterium]|nr:hypothetical protein [Flavobacteriales bacterium]